MTTRTLLALASAAFLAACAGAPATEPAAGVSVHASFAVQPGVIAVVSINAQPANVDTNLTYDAASGQYLGALALPAGPQNLTVNAYTDANLDGELELLATGSATTVVTEGQVAAVMVRLVTTAPPPPAPDHAPIISSFEVANSNPQPGQSVAVSVAATDVDGDAIAYEWLVGCNAGTVTIADPTAAATSFSVDAAATCTVSVGVSANGKVAWEQIPLQVGGPGQVDVSISFAAAPMVTQVSLADRRFACTVDRTATEASCDRSVGTSAEVEVWVAVDEDSADALVSLWTCGGSRPTLVETVGTQSRFTWTAPEISGVCVVTARVFRDGLVDSLPVAMLIR